MNIDRVLILDTETDGVDSETSKCLEVACITYSLKYRAPIEAFSSLIRAQSNAAEQINGIPVDLLKDANQAEDVWCLVELFIDKCDLIVAHNAEFDKQFIPANLAKSKPWICSMSDLEYPNYSNSKSLVAIALAHGVGVVHAHRAMSDVDTLSRLFTRLGEMGNDLEKMFQRGMRPKSNYQALVSFNEKDKAKTAGFGWNGDSKQWTKKIFDDFDFSSLDFKVKKL